MIAQEYRSAPRKPPENQKNEAEAMEKYPIFEKRNKGLEAISGAGETSLICSLLQHAGIAIRLTVVGQL